MENVIIIDIVHITAFFLGTIVGSIVTASVVWLLIPSMVRGAFKKLH